MLGGGVLRQQTLWEAALWGRERPVPRENCRKPCRLASPATAQPQPPRRGSGKPFSRAVVGEPERRHLQRPSLESTSDTPQPRSGPFQPHSRGLPGSAFWDSTRQVSSLCKPCLQCFGPLSAEGWAHCPPGSHWHCGSSQQPWGWGAPLQVTEARRELRKLQARTELTARKQQHRAGAMAQPPPCLLGPSQYASSPLLSSVLVHLSLSVGGQGMVPRGTVCPGSPTEGSGQVCKQIGPITRQEAPLSVGSRPAAMSTAPRSPLGPAVNNIPSIMTMRGCQFSAAMDSSSAVH